MSLLSGYVRAICLQSTFCLEVAHPSLIIPFTAFEGERSAHQEESSYILAECRREETGSESVLVMLQYDEVSSERDNLVELLMLNFVYIIGLLHHHADLQVAIFVLSYHFRHLSWQKLTILTCFLQFPRISTRR
jgi:hypothetical protein